MNSRNIYLIGFSGTGKSTVARMLGVELGWPDRDVDQLIVAQSGMAIPAIFAAEGEEGFRVRESLALRTAAEVPPAVVATGGGAILREENRALMAATGWVITLEARPETIQRRIAAQLRQATPDAVRPLLNAADQLEQARALKQRRQSLYALADWTVHTDRLNAEQVVAEIIRAVDLLGKLPDPWQG